MLLFLLARIIFPLKNQVNFWSRLTFLDKYLISFRGFKEQFSGTLEKISDRRAFRIFETVTCSLIRRVDNRAIL